VTFDRTFTVALIFLVAGWRRMADPDIRILRSVQFIQKPFSVKGLAYKIREVLKEEELNEKPEK
jgi:hypothetical protein